MDTDSSMHTTNSMHTILSLLRPRLSYDDDDVIGLRDPASFPDAPTCILLASIHTTSSLYSRVVVATENIIREVDKGEDVPARLAQ